MKIKVEAVDSRNELGFETDGEIKMVRYKGGLINLGGRSLPF